MKESAFRRRWSMVLLGATLVSLLITVIAGYLTRLSLVDASEWVAHTDEVKLAINDCELALLRRDATGLKSAEQEVERLTRDNPYQQQRVTRAVLLTERGEDVALEEVFASMGRAEDRLLFERLHRLAAMRTRSSAAFIIASVLSVAFGAAAFGILQVHRRDLARQRALLEALIEGVDEGIVAVAPSRQIIAINGAARALWGGAPPLERWPEDWRPSLRATYEDGRAMLPEEAPLARALRGEVSEAVVCRVSPANAPTDEPGVWISASARPIQDDEGRTIAAVTTLRNITGQRAQAERLRDQSLRDELTGLLNRRGFLTLANAKIAESRRTKTPTALLYVDVNGLKRINDELGHEQGDRVIEDAARVLRGIFRGGDIVARLGGDEFVALLSTFTQSASDALLERLVNAIRAHGQEGRPFRLSMSYGITFMDWEHEESLDALLAAADRLMYARKRERAGHSVPVLREVRPPPSRSKPDVEP